jgi:SAM-dependent methyltransferase
MSDSLQPPVASVLADWAARVQADRAQVERCREVGDPPDFYAPVAHRFSLDPRRHDDPTLGALLRLAHSEESWLDVGAGGGRYALPLARVVRQVFAVEPSAAMIEVLRAGMREHGIRNVRVVQASWPMDDAPTAEVALLSHVGYDIADMGPFLEGLENSAGRLCVAVMGESAMTTVATLFWQDIHGEPRVRLPALPELLVLLTSRGRLPEVRLVGRQPPTFETREEALAMARRQLWLREGSRKDALLQRALADELEEHDGRFAFDWRPTRVGIVSWEPG